MTSIAQSGLLLAAGLTAGTFLFAGQQPANRTSDEPATSAKPDAPAATPGGNPQKDAGWLGLRFDERPSVAGAPIVAVFPGGPAAFAGVRVGDRLVKVGDTVVGSHTAAGAALEKLKPGQKVTLRVLRGETGVSLQATVGSLAQFHQSYTQEMLRRDPRDPKFADNHGVSAADQHVELVRRLFEQNERLERSIESLRDEVQALRDEVKKANTK